MPSMAPIRDAAVNRRAALLTQIEKLTATVAAEGRTALTPEEAVSFAGWEAEIRELDPQIDNFNAALDREQKSARDGFTDESDGTEKRGSGWSVSRSPMTYEKFAPTSYLADQAYVAVHRKYGSHREQAAAAEARMTQHGKEIEIEARRNPELGRALDEVQQRTAEQRAQEQRITDGTTGTGGDLIPPLWLVQDYIKVVRPGRVFADRLKPRPLPTGTNVVNLPKINPPGTQVLPQLQQGGGVASRDILTSFVSGPVVTIAGQLDLSLQLVDQSPLDMTSVVFEDLRNAYDQDFDQQIIAGQGTGQLGSPTHLGILSVPGATTNTSQGNASFINSTNTALVTATGSNQWRDVVNGVNQIETLRFAPPTAIWAAPRRVNYWATAMDSNGRPVFIPEKYGIWNGVGRSEDAPMYQGVAGEMFGLPVVKDQNMTNTANGFGASTLNLTGSNQDAVVVLREDDIYLWEGALRLRVLPEILSGMLMLRLQLFAYSAMIAQRYPQAISVISGSGYGAPSF